MNKKWQIYPSLLIFCNLFPGGCGGVFSGLMINGPRVHLWGTCQTQVSFSVIWEDLQTACLLRMSPSSSDFPPLHDNSWRHAGLTRVSASPSTPGVLSLAWAHWTTSCSSILKWPLVPGCLTTCLSAQHISLGYFHNFALCLFWLIFFVWMELSVTADIVLHCMSNYRSS